MSSVRTVKVTNVSTGATEKEIREFFSFSGDIDYIEMLSNDGQSQIAYVTFKDPKEAETAVLLTGATIIDLSVSIALDPDYKLPFAAPAPTPAPAPSDAEGNTAAGSGTAFHKAEDVVSTMLAKGYTLGKDALTKAKNFDEQHQLSSSASATVASLDKKIGLSEKIIVGTTVVGDKVREVDQKFQVSEKTKSAFAAAEEKVSTAGSALMKNRYVLTGTSWVTGAFNRATKAAEEVGQKAKEKAGNSGENADEGTTQVHESAKASN